MIEKHPTRASLLLNKSLDVLLALCSLHMRVAPLTQLSPNDRTRRSSRWLVGGALLSVSCSVRRSFSCVAEGFGEQRDRGQAERFEAHGRVVACPLREARIGGKRERTLRVVVARARTAAIWSRESSSRSIMCSFTECGKHTVCSLIGSDHSNSAKTRISSRHSSTWSAST
jgi:hypothetical protein